jgi:hypothetical protein
MKSTSHNVSDGPNWKRCLPLLPIALLPIGLIGFSLRPAFEYVALADDLAEVRGLDDEAQRLAQVVAAYGEGGLPTAQYEALLEAVAGRLPRGFEPTTFYDHCIAAARGLDLELESISAGLDLDLAAPVGADATLHSQSVTLQGTGALRDLEQLLVALHRRGQPVGVLQTKLDALASSDRFDFQLELAVYHLATPTAQFDDASDVPTGDA